MDKVSQISAQMLRDGRRTIAQRICARLANTPGSTGNDVVSSDFEERIEQFATHVHVLAACIKFHSPVLLDNYVLWIADLPKEVSPYDCDISRFFKELQDFVENGFPRVATQVIQSYIDGALNSLQNPIELKPEALPQNPEKVLQGQYLEALLAKRQGEAVQLALGAVEAGTGVQSIYLNVIQPTQQEIGRLWQTGEINVAQEHYCTAATQTVMSKLQPYFMTADSTGKTLVASCVGDELHDVGLRIVTDLFEIDGWNTIYIGANTPAASVAETVVSSNAEVLAVSTTMAQHLFGVAEVIRVVRSTPGCEQVKILVGGYPFNIDPLLWKRVGADANALDGKDAVDAANRVSE